MKKLVALKNRRSHRPHIRDTLYRLRYYSILPVLLIPILTLLVPPAAALVENDATIVYGEGSNTSPRSVDYLSGSDEISSSTTLPSASGTVKMSITKSAPTRDEIIAGVVTASNSLRIYRYNGSSWSAQWNVTLPDTHTPSFDIAYQQTSGNAMVIYSRNASTTNELVYRIWNGSSWTSATNLDTARTSGIVHAVRAEPRRGTNEIGLAWVDSNRNISTNYWTGTTWQGEPNTTLGTDLKQLNTGDSRIQSAVFDIAFEEQGGELMVLWVTNSDSGFHYVNRSTGATGGWLNPVFRQLGTGGSTVLPASVSLKADPLSDYIALSMQAYLSSTLDWRHIGPVWSGEDWVIDTATVHIATPAAGKHQHDVAWTTQHNITQAHYYIDGAADNILYRKVYVKSSNTFSVPEARPLPIASYNMVRFVQNPHHPNEATLLLLGSNVLLAYRTIFDGSILIRRAATVTNNATTPSSGSGWAASFVHRNYIPATAPTPNTPHLNLLYSDSTTIDVISNTKTLSSGSWSASNIASYNYPEQTVVESSPTRDEKIAVTTQSDGFINVLRWNGVNWATEWSTVTGLGYVPRVAIAYEQLSGRALVIYSRNTSDTNEIGYRIWDGEGWSTEHHLDAVRTSGVVQYITAASRPGSNELAIAWADSNLDLSANFWTGSAWAGERSTPLETELGTLAGYTDEITTPIVDLAFESQSGNLMVAWGHDWHPPGDPDINATLRRAVRTAGPSGTWGNVLGTNFVWRIRTIRLASDPNSDAIAMTFHSNGRADGTNSNNIVRFGYWTGSGWSAHSGAYTSSTMTPGESDLDVMWLRASNKSAIVYAFDLQSGTAGTYYIVRNHTDGTWMTNPVVDTGSPTPTHDKSQVTTLSDPHDPAKGSIVMVDKNNDLFVKNITFNGTGTSVTLSAGEGGGSPLSTTIDSTETMGWKVGATYNYPLSTPSSLNTNIVNASGFPVPNPSVSMVGVAISNTCQVATGVFGTNGQRIRVENNTANRRWTLSLAPTDGVTANWSSETATYDFNDPAGSPAGCGDGGDADTIAGQLTVNPNAGTIVGKSGCSTTHISKGSSGAFNQGSTDAITLMSSSILAPTNCYWDLLDVELSQRIPAYQAGGRYTINMTVTVVAN